MTIDEIYQVGFIIGIILLIPITLYELKKFNQLKKYETRFQETISEDYASYSSVFHNTRKPPTSILEYYSSQDTQTLHLIHLDLLSDKEEATNRFFISNISSIGIPTIAVFATVIGLITSKIEGPEGLSISATYSMVFMLIVLFMIIFSTVESVFQSLKTKRINKHLLIVEKVIDLKKSNIDILSTPDTNQSEVSISANI